MVLAWENLHQVLWCSSFCCCSSFVNVLHSHFLFDIIHHPSVDYRWVFTLILYFQSSPLQSDSRHFHFQPFRYLLIASATVLSGHFLPKDVFYLTLLPDTFGTICFYQGLPGRRKFLLEVCRASYWSSKHRPGPSVCLIHSNPQSFIHPKFVFIHVNFAKVLLVVKTLIKKYYYFFQVQFLRIRLSGRSATTLISQQPWKYKAAATLIRNHNSKKIAVSKNTFEKNLRMVSSKFFNPLVSKHIKNLFSKLRFYKMTF